MEDSSKQQWKTYLSTIVLSFIVRKGVGCWLFALTIAGWYFFQCSATQENKQIWLPCSIPRPTHQDTYKTKYTRSINIIEKNKQFLETTIKDLPICHCSITSIVGCWLFALTIAGRYFLWQKENRKCYSVSVPTHALRIFVCSVFNNLVTPPRTPQHNSQTLN